MNHAILRFYAELNDFLAPFDRGRPLRHAFVERASVKDVIEAHGVPHTEVDLLLVNGEPRPFAHVVREGDRISVFPAFRRLDIASVSLVRPPPLAEFRCVLDVHLGRLAAYLRMAGFDSAYPGGQTPDRDLADTAARENRVLLTRDVGLLKRSLVRYGYWVRATVARVQFFEVMARFDLAPGARPFTRCLRCNAPIEPRSRDRVLDRLPARTRQYYDEFWTCTGCGRVYWKGPHYRWMKATLDEVLAGPA